MCAKFYRNRTFTFKVMIKKPISDEKFRKTILEKMVQSNLFKKSPPFPQCNVDPSHLPEAASGRPT